MRSISKTLITFFQSETFLKMATMEFERHLRKEAGGESIFVSKTTCLEERKERNELIKQCWTGTNIDFLSDKFGLTRQQIYRILKKK
jgi:Mor family transcriptional regulator